MTNIRKIFLSPYFFLGLLCCSQVSAEIDVNIRAASSLTENSAIANYVANLSDCRKLVSISAGSSSQMKDYSPIDAIQSSGNPESCFLPFTRKGRFIQARTEF